MCCTGRPQGHPGRQASGERGQPAGRRHRLHTNTPGLPERKCAAWRAARTEQAPYCSAAAGSSGGTAARFQQSLHLVARAWDRWAPSSAAVLAGGGAHTWGLKSLPAGGLASIGASGSGGAAMAVRHEPCSCTRTSRRSNFGLEAVPLTPPARPLCRSHPTLHSLCSHKALTKTRARMPVW